MFPVCCVHTSVCGRCSGGSVCGGEQCVSTHPFNAQTGYGGPEHFHLHRQQTVQCGDLRDLPAWSTVLPHLVPHIPLLIIESCPLLPDNHDAHEHHDSHLFLPPPPNRLLQQGAFSQKWS